MKLSVLLVVIGTFLLGASNLHAQFTWNGLAGDDDISTGGNWVGGIAPTGVSGLDDLEFTAPGSFAPSFYSAFSVHNLTIPAGAGFYNLTGLGQLTLTGDITTQEGAQSGILFGTPMTLAAGTHTITTGGLFSEQNGADVYFFSQIDGAGDIVKLGVNNSLYFDHAGNTFSGLVDLQQGNLYVHGDGALGTGVLKLNGGTLIGVDYYDDGHLTVLNNNVSLSDSVYIGNSYGKGSITIAGTTTAQTGVGTVTLQVSGNGILTFGDLAESDPLTTFAFEGDALTRITGLSTHTGGTQANSGARVIFASAVPAVGSLQTTNDGYIGSEVTTGIQAGFIDRFDPANTFGVIGFDSPNINSPQVFAEAINLSLAGFDPGVRLGTMTSAVLSGTLTPQGSDYLFGGRGILTINSAITDVSGTAEVQVYDGLQLFLHGTNTYTGETQAVRGAIIFNSAGAMPALADIYADSAGYIGQTESTGLSVAAYFARFYAPETYGVVGFDADDAVLGRTVTGLIDFSIFDTGTAYLGTATNVTFTGAITPFNGEYRFTGFRDGHLTIDSPLTGSDSVVIGLAGNDVASIAPPGQVFSPSVKLTAANSYSGGTTLQSGQLILGNASALGTGLLTIDLQYVNDQPAGLTTNAPGFTIANPIYFNSSYGFYVGGSNDFTLSGNFTDNRSGFDKIGANTVTLSGDNSAFDGAISVRNGTLIFATNTSAGTGGLFLDDVDGYHGHATFSSNNPSVGPLGGRSVTTLDLGPGTLTVNQSYDDTYSGTIVGGGSLTKSGPGRLTLEGNNAYGGNTAITDGTLVAGSDNALGGTVTVRGGTLSLSRGVTLSNPVVFGASGGTLGGNGTFGSAITIGANAHLAPGNSPGLITFTGGLTFAPSGTYDIQVQSAAGPRGVGYDSIDVTGGLTFTATLGNPFTLSLHSLDMAGNPGQDVADFVNTNGYAWLVAHSDSLGGFDQNNITIDTTNFTNGLGIGAFNVSAVGNDIFLNFSPVPEPSTYALLGLGLGAVLFPVLRRRRRV